MKENELLIEFSAKQRNKCIIRLRTTTWSDKTGIHIKKSLTFLRRKCRGFNVLEEDISAIGAGDVLPRIINLGECRDGIYEVVTYNESRDWESGYVDDYDYKLVTNNEGIQQ